MHATNCCFLLQSRMISKRSCIPFYLKWLIFLSFETVIERVESDDRVRKGGENPQTKQLVSKVAFNPGSGRQQRRIIEII